MYHHEKLCLPENLVRPVLRAHHEWLGHIGVDRLILEVGLRYEIPQGINLREILEDIKKRCQICQACDRPNWSARGPLSMTVVPSRFMASVALDVFSMPIAT